MKVSNVALPFLALSLLSVGSLRAEPFTILPSGDLVFNGALTTHGSFRCIQGLGSVCTGAGTSSVTFGSGPDTSTVTFTGASSTVPIGNVVTPVLLGRIGFTTTGAGFSFPETLNPNVGVLLMTLTMSQSSPAVSTRTFQWFFRPRADDQLQLFMAESYTSFPLGPMPHGFHYTSAVYTFAPFPFTLTAGGSTDVTANVGAVPEPATLVLVGSAAVAAALRRRRRPAAAP